MPKFQVPLKGLLRLYFLTILALLARDAVAAGTQCSDRVDNDNDGRIDALVEYDVSRNSETVSVPTADLIRALVNSAYNNVVPTEWSRQGYIRDDAATATEVCRLKGYARVATFTTNHFSTCGDNKIAYFQNGTIQLANACTHNRWLSSITCAGRFPRCRNGIDDDGDGVIDTKDSGCASANDDDEAPHDLGCSSLSDTSENTDNPACNDGVDNDGDGAMDYPADPGCRSLTDTSEREAGGAACDNGVDDDGDGKVDYPADPDCSSAGDLDERSAPPPPVVNNFSCSTTNIASEIAQLDGAAMFLQDIVESLTKQLSSKLRKKKKGAVSYAEQVINDSLTYEHTAWSEISSMPPNPSSCVNFVAALCTTADLSFKIDSFNANFDKLYELVYDIKGRISKKKQRSTKVKQMIADADELKAVASRLTDPVNGPLPRSDTKCSNPSA